MVTFACVASGPSLSSSDCQKLLEANIPIIAVNNSWRAAPFCSAIYAADCCWWEEYIEEITSPATRWCGDSFTANRFGINHHESKVPGSFNSGQRAIELAIHLGAQRVLLVGYDCSIRHGAHWHGRHSTLANPDNFSVNHWHEEFKRLQQEYPSIEVLNCSRRTRMNCFPIMSLEAALSL
ncbi:hypothetical protein FH968_20550 [Buttiauxella sp. B2]|uniref:hypothetical protein n=1 Tax=Buttiauxella sp. B2 TaxID=2587812 RepID=UPI0011209933|nr:hypothetical protein [Buttiauxella sp. B2]TNV14917.1 hypothetical protein FH968_20550 [Buttiauxella sp. B2]